MRKGMEKPPGILCHVLPAAVDSIPHFVEWCKKTCKTRGRYNGWQGGLWMGHRQVWSKTMGLVSSAQIKRCVLGTPADMDISNHHWRQPFGALWAHCCHGWRWEDVDIRRWQQQWPGPQRNLSLSVLHRGMSMTSNNAGLRCADLRKQATV